MIIYLPIHHLVRIFLKTVLCILSISFTMDVFAATKITAPKIPQETTASENSTPAPGSNTEAEVSSETGEEDSPSEREIENKKKDREKTINDINTFLIETYKLKIDRILANLNTSIERVTNNDPVAQAKLLEKIRGDIDAKIQIINSRDISENRKKILSSVFAYIQENLEASISRLAGRK